MGGKMLNVDYIKRHTFRGVKYVTLPNGACSRADCGWAEFLSASGYRGVYMVLPSGAVVTLVGCA